MGNQEYKCIAIGMPYIFLVVDILSWWLTKINPMFAFLVIFAGTGMGISFAFMWIISILEMWRFEKTFLNPKTGELRHQLSRFVEEQLKVYNCDEVIKCITRYSKQAIIFIFEKTKQFAFERVKRRN